MGGLIVYYGISKGKKILNIVTGAYLAAFCLYFSITGWIANTLDILFFCSLVGFILAAILILRNIWLSPSTMSVGSDVIDVNITGQKKMKIDWVNVSQVNIGVSYIVFLINGGQKQQKLDLSRLYYKDVQDVKSKVVEISEFKSIPYQND